MPQWTLSILTSFAPTLFIAVVTSVLTVRLSLHRFHAERWWERKAEAYSRIVETLHQLMEYHAAMSEDAMNYKERDEAQFAKLHDEYQQAYRDLRKATGIGAYIIFDEVAAALASLDARPRPKWSREEPPWEPYDAEFEAYKEALEQIRRLAKKDLNVL
jgi:hypothetical protein